MAKAQQIRGFAEVGTQYIRMEKSPQRAHSINRKHSQPLPSSQRAATQNCKQSSSHSSEVSASVPINDLIMLYHHIARLFIFIGIAILVHPVSAMTNEMLLEQRLISPAIYELLNKHGATTPEKRQQIIGEACAARQLAPIDCQPLIKHRTR